MARFLEIHTLTSYSASLLNRDDVGMGKRIPFGGAERGRISSQCLKRHWRTARDENALSSIRLEGKLVPMSIRSRRTFNDFLCQPLIAEGVSPETAHALTGEFLDTLLPKGKKKQAAASADESDVDVSQKVYTDQVTVLGKPEVDYLLSLARQLVSESFDAKSVKAAFTRSVKGELKKNLMALRHGAGLDAALFGRMTTGDILARCDAAIHVAHSFTVHDGQFETDYFSAIDDLQGPEETGSGHINTAELSTGLYYGYVVVDIPLLVSNLEGCDRAEWESADCGLAAEVVRRLVKLVATVSPGAKLGSTAPYAHASVVLLEAGSRQPRSLANAFLDPIPTRPGMEQFAQDAIVSYLSDHDKMLGKKPLRMLAALRPKDELCALVDGRLNLPSLADWAASQVKGAE